MFHINIIRSITLKLSNNTFEGNSSLVYRAWPVFMLAFVRLFYVSIFERALSNYLYFTINISESTLGFISSAGAVAYIFAPILGQFITLKLGIRTSIIVSAFFTPVLTGAQIFFPEPWFLIVCRIILGLSMGVFWPNCFNLLSRWQKVSDKKRADRNFRNFNFSWNLGFLSGLMVGYLWALFWNDFFAMLISWGISFLLIPISFLLDKDKITAISTEETKIQIEMEDHISHADREGELNPLLKTPMIVFPILFSWLGMLFLSISKSSFMFSYPILLKAAGQDSSWTYLSQFGIQALQLVGLTLINSMNIHRRKLAAISSVIIVSILASSLLIFNDIWVVSVITPLTGLFFGFVHGTALKIMLEYGIDKNTTTYSTINEILIGIGFGLTPIFAGYVGEVNILIMFMFVAVFGLTIFIALLYLSRKVKRVKI